MNREQLISKAMTSKTQWDIIIIGGGATGLGIAVESAGRGYRTLLLEKGDFASGTSSNSTKLIHGGIRYLKDFNPPRLRESAKEQNILKSIAPHLVENIPFIIPSTSKFRHLLHRIGLIFFDILTWAGKERRSYSLKNSKIKELVSNLNTTDLKGGIHYLDCQFDDARFALTLARTAERDGAIPLNYMDVTSLLKENGKVCGVIAKDSLTSSAYEFFSNVVINACGPFVDALREEDQKDSVPLIMPMQGTHIVLPLKFLGDKTAFIIPDTSKGRVLYAIPWKGKALIGTTETLLEEASFNTKPLKEEVDYLLKEISAYLDIPPTHSDVLSVFSGIRPLVKPQSKVGSKIIPRDHSVVTSSSGLITITGGKWTTYRIMAEDTLRIAATLAKLPYESFSSSKIKLHGWEIDKNKDERLKSYGTDSDKIFALEKNDPSLSLLLHPDLLITKSMIYFAVIEEMATTLEDVLSRRTRVLLLNAKATLEIAPEVVEYLAELLSKDRKWCEEELDKFRVIAKSYQV